MILAGIATFSLITRFEDITCMCILWLLDCTNNVLLQVSIVLTA